MAGRSRKVKKWMIDKKIPQYLRDGLPIICCGDEIAAIFYEHQWYVAHGFASRGVSKTELWVRLEVED